MKRPLTILAVTLLAVAVLVACASTIRTGKTSIVTITIGGSAGTAVLKAEAATPWTRLKHYLADAKWVSEAYAYIPSVVQVLVVTVTAPDIATPIVGVANVKPTDTVVTIRLDIPNGTARQFKVEGIRGVDSQTYFVGVGGPVDLNGADISLSIVMAPPSAGPGILVSAQSPSAIDTTGCGTAATPCRSISFALTQTTGTDALIVQPGTYAPVGAGGSESFPLQLKPGNALVCTGPTLSTVIVGPGVSFAPMISGGDNTSIDNCFFKVGQGSTGIDDHFNQGISTAMKINGSVFELPTRATNQTIGVIMTHDKSLLLDSSLTGTAVISGVVGVQVLGGRPSIIGNTISSLTIGIEVTGGDPVITNSTIDSNSTGMSIPSAGKPLVSGSVFSNNGTGIDVSAGTADISTSTFTGNSTGLFISGGAPRIQTSEISNNGSYGVHVTGTTSDPDIAACRIYCNFNFNVFTQGTTVALRASNNSWENAPPLVSSTFNGCIQGDDVCYDYLGPVPLTDPYNPAAIAPGTCNRPVGKPAK